MECWIMGSHGLGVRLINPPLHYSINPFFLPAGSSNSRTSPFEGDYGGANPSPAAIFGKSSFDRSVVK